MLPDIEIGCFQQLLHECQNNLGDELSGVCAQELYGFCLVKPAVFEVMALTLWFPVKSHSVTLFLLLNRKKSIIGLRTCIV